MGDEEGGQVGYLGSCEETGWRGERDAFFGHAVDASKVAALSDADAKVVVLAREAVGEKGRKRFGILKGFFSLCLSF